MPISTIKRQSSMALEASKSQVSKSNMGGDMDFGRGKTLIKPEDQLQLTEAELSEEVERELTIKNTRVPDNIMEWSYKINEYVAIPHPPNIITLLDIPGSILHKESKEAILQMSGKTMDGQTDEIKKIDDNGEEKVADEDEGIGEEEQNGEGEEDSRKETVANGGDYDEEEDEEKSKPKKVPNQFNFCDRAALTYPTPLKDMTTETMPPPTASCDGTIHQWQIYDDYMEEYHKQQREKEKDRKVHGHQRKEDPKKKAQDNDAAMTNRMLQSAKTLERMVNQNVFDEISQDYRYWDDPSDEYKPGEGTLLPLWKFNYKQTKKHDVTDVCFNSKYYDLFAVAYGSMNYDDPMPNGAICLFSLKNPSFPEWICTTESPVMCLDFNKENPHFLVIGVFQRNKEKVSEGMTLLGCMDGSAAVYNVMLPSTTPQYKSNDVTQKHTGIIWQVCWGPKTEDGNMAFYSVSIDGNINYWLLNQNELGVTTIMTLFLDNKTISGPDGTTIPLKGCGTCIVFHPNNPNVFLVGTEEGTIYKCNTAYSTVYMQTFADAHEMPVYRIVFNKFNSSIFASCSGDWRVKIWEDERLEPLFVFDLGVPIGDVQWAPYSSTVLACVSNDGKVWVFDLNLNKYRAICSQAVVSKRLNKLTRLAFSNVLPFIIVGDDKGTINTLKLSPNLRIKVKPTKKQLELTHLELEIMKLEKLLSFVREPAVLIPPRDEKENN